MWKTITILLLNINPFLLNSQNEIDNSYSLQIEDLKRLKKVVLFRLDKYQNGSTKKQKGIILLTSKGEWKKYKLLSKFEDLGNINHIEKINNTFCVFFDKVTLILNDDSTIEKLDCISTVFTIRNKHKLYSINYKDWKTVSSISSISGKEVYAYHLIEYNLKTKILRKHPIKKFPGHISEITGIEYVFGKFWISTYSRHGDTASSLLFSISKTGEISPEKIDMRIFPWSVFKIKKHKGGLLIISPDGIKRMNRKKETTLEFCPEDFMFVADAVFQNKFMVWSTYDYNASYDDQAMETKSYQKHIYNLENGTMYSLTKSGLCCNKIKIVGDKVLTYDYKRGQIEERNMHNINGIKYHKIKK